MGRNNGETATYENAKPKTTIEQVWISQTRNTNTANHTCQQQNMIIRKIDATVMHTCAIEQHSISTQIIASET